MAEAIPQEPLEQWSAWSFIRVDVERAEMEHIFNAAEGDRIAATAAVLEKHATVSEATSGLPGLFGRVDVGTGTAPGELVEDWRQDYPDDPVDWLDSLAAQVKEAAKKRTPRPDAWVRFREAEGDDEFVIGVGRTNKDLTHLHFDCFFFGLVPWPPSRTG